VLISTGVNEIGGHIQCDTYSECVCMRVCVCAHACARVCARVQKGHVLKKTGTLWANARIYILYIYILAFANEVPVFLHTYTHTSQSHYCAGNYLSVV
jgi:hypothetical protein